MALPNLHGYWKYGDAVVPFRIEPEDRPQVARAFIPRQRPALVAKEVKELPPRKLELAAKEPESPSSDNGHDEIAEELVAIGSDDLDTTF